MHHLSHEATRAARPGDRDYAVDLQTPVQQTRDTIEVHHVFLEVPRFRMLRHVTRDTIEVHHVFSEVPRFRMLRHVPLNPTPTTDY